MHIHASVSDKQAWPQHVSRMVWVQNTVRSGKRISHSRGRFSIDVVDVVLLLVQLGRLAVLLGENFGDKVLQLQLCHLL